MQLSSLFRRLSACVDVSPPCESFRVCGAASLYLWCFSGEAGRGGDPSPAGQSLDGRHCWSCPELGMLNGGREGLFELGQQLQQQGEYQAALHCFLSCLLGLTHVQSFTSLPNCLHQVSPKPRDTRSRTSCTHSTTDSQLHLTQPPNLLYHVLAWSITHTTVHGTFNLDMTGSNVSSDSWSRRPCAGSRR